jgi:hypothetical protein
VTDRNSTIWTGIELTGATPDIEGYEYAYVSGELTVPAVAPCIYSGSNESSLWVGLDDSSVLTQDGTESDVFVDIFGDLWHNYYAWVEYFPNDTVVINNLSVNPGDVVQVTAWIGQGGAQGCSLGEGLTGCYSLFDITTGVGGTTSLPAPSGTVAVEGLHAEWIAENPNGGAQYLADFGVTRMSHHQAQDFNRVVHTYKTDPYTILTMNDLDTVNATCWINDNAGSPTEGDFQYYWDNCE